MKILFVFNHPAPYKVNLLNGLSKYHELDVIFERKGNSNRPENFYYQKENKFQFKYHFCSGIKIGEENHIGFYLKRFIKKNHKNYDLIIMNGYSTISEIIAIKYMIKHNIRYTLYVNGGKIRSDKNTYKLNLKKELISKAFNYFSPCQETNQYLIHYGADKKKIYNYIYSTVYEKEVLPCPLSRDDKKRIRLSNGLDISSTINFVTFGQFIDRKNNKPLLEIFKNLPDNYHLTLIGDGEEKDQYQDFIINNNLSNKIKILPFKTQIELLPFLRNYDYFISISKEDIYGHMINEALSQGLPVIASNAIVSANALIKSGINGIIVKYDDISAIKDAIINCQTLESSECIKTAQENTIEKMIESHLKIFEELQK